MIALGGKQKISFNAKDASGTTDRVVFTFRQPTNQERNEYMAKCAPLVTKLSEEESVLKLFEIRAEYSMRVISEAEGFEPPEDMTTLEALEQFGQDYLNQFALYIYDGARQTITVAPDLGKSERGSSSSKKGESASSNGPTASTSSRRTRGSGKSSAGTAQTSASA